MSKAKLPVALLLLIAGLWTGLKLWRAAEESQAHDFLVFDRDGTTCPIIVPTQPTGRELMAARLISETLAASAGVDPLRFPIVREKEWRPGQRGVFVGATERAGKLYQLAGSSLLERPVACMVTPDGAIVRARWRDDIAIAAATFLENAVHARWFMPGELGREVDRIDTLRLKFGDEVFRPAYFSRNLGGLERVEEVQWGFVANRLITLFEHSHTAAKIFGPELARSPEIAPQINGRLYRPTGPDDQAWQPNFTSVKAVDVAVAKAKEQFKNEPARVSFAIGENDTIKFDQSPATFAAIAPARWFREQPDYTELLTGFLNKVAGEVGRDFPDRFITTYAYYWTQNAPRGKVEATVLPFLCADRSGWFDPKFAANDRDLIKRWGAAGPRMIGLYDYYYGAPFFVPRPTLYAVSGPIPFAYEQGARAFYAESYPNWGLDGPKLWLATQLLWDPHQNASALLDEYYHRFWREAAKPMREFFELCDKQWLEQPLPAVWIKYYKNDQQRLLFPPAVRARLRSALDRAYQLANDRLVKQRVQFVSAAFAVSDLFCEHDELREELERLALQTDADSTVVVRTFNRYSTLRNDLRDACAELRERFPLAINSELIGDYLRVDPRRRIVWDFAQRGEPLSRLNEAALRSLFGGRGVEAAELRGHAREVMADPALKTLRKKSGPEFTLLEWNGGREWQTRTEPYETRRIELVALGGGAQAVRYTGCKTESLWQSHRVEPGALYLASATVHARVSPGNATYLIVSFNDADNKYLGVGHVDRLPVGEWPEGTALKVFVRAPRAAATINAGVCLTGQDAADFAEFSHVSLQRLE